MPFEITMPQLGLTMENGTVVEWLVKEGEQVSTGQEIFQVETDKSIFAVEARQDGTIARILVAEGQVVPVGTVLAIGTKPGETLDADWQPMQPGKAAVPMPEPIPQPTELSAEARVAGSIQASWSSLLPCWEGADVVSSTMWPGAHRRGGRWVTGQWGPWSQPFLMRSVRRVIVWYLETSVQTHHDRYKHTMSGRGVAEDAQQGQRCDRPGNRQHSPLG